LELETRGYLQTDPAARMGYYQAGQAVGAFTAEYVQDLERIPQQYRPTEPEPEPEPEPAQQPPEEDDDADV